MRNFHFHFTYCSALLLVALLGSPIAQAQKPRTAKPAAQPATSATTTASPNLSVEMLPPPSAPAAKVAASKVPRSSTTGQGAPNPAAAVARLGQPVPPELPEKVKEAARIVSDSFGAPVELVETFMREAMWLQKNEKVPAAAFVGLAILESAGFSSELYQKAKNPFGMKATKPLWTGPVHKMWHEGKMTDFRKYDTPRGAVQDFAKFLRSRKWFRDAFQCEADDYNCFIDKMMADAEKKEPGYARDPEWGNKIRRVIKKYQLEPLSEP